MAAATGSTDAAGVAAWLAVAEQIIAEIQRATVSVSVSDLTATTESDIGGGPVARVVGTGTGTGKIT